ncbi:MAG TPA: hypothetical protein VII58_04880 [Acidobacteriaceae bacterium]
MTSGRDPLTVSVGSGTIYYAAIGTAEPATLTGAWVSGWINVGYTEKGTTFTRGVTATDIDVAEEFYSIGEVITGYTGTIDFALSQMTAENMSIAFNGGTITTNIVDVYFDPPAAGAEVYAMLGWQSNDGTERYIWRKVIQTGATATSRQKVLPQALIPVSFKMFKPPSLQPFRWMGSITPINRAGV